MYPSLFALVGYGLGAGGAGGTGASGTGAGVVGIGGADSGGASAGLRLRAVGSGSSGAFWARAKLPIARFKTASTIIVLVRDFIFYSFHSTNQFINISGTILGIG